MELLGYSGYLIFLCNYSNTLHFNLSELGILMSFPSFVSLPFHVSIPLARPCNPFSVTYRQTKNPRTWEAYSRFHVCDSVITVLEPFLIPFKRQLQIRQSPKKLRWCDGRTWASYHFTSDAVIFEGA